MSFLWMRNKRHQRKKTRMMSDFYSFKKIMVENDCRFNLVKQLL